MHIRLLISLAGLLLLGAAAPGLAFEPGDEVVVVSAESRLRLPSEETFELAKGAVYLFRGEEAGEVVLGNGYLRGVLEQGELLLLDEAKAHFAAEIAAENEPAANLMALGWVLSFEDEVQLAEEHFSQAIDLDRLNAELYEERGDFYFYNSQYYPAVEDFSRALRLKGDDAELYVKRGNARNSGLTRITNHIQADFNRAIELEPDLAAAYLGLGRFYAREWEDRPAMDNFEHALRLEPENLEALRLVASMAATSSEPQLRDGERAVELATRRMEMLDEPNAWDYAHLAEAYAETSDFESAIEHIEHALSLLEEDDIMRGFLEDQLEDFQQGRPRRRNRY